LVSGTKGRGFESRIAYHNYFKYLKRIIKRKNDLQELPDATTNRGRPLISNLIYR
jgi:hypothetical protein